MINFKIPISIIVARASNGVIGYQNSLPWHIPEDLKNFKKVTIGKPIVMGRKTFESIGKPLMNRKNFVVTSQKDWFYEGVEICNDLIVALKSAEKHALLTSCDEVFVIGGSSLYKNCINFAKKIYLTEVYRNYIGDVWFKELDKAFWTEISSDFFISNKNNNLEYAFKVFERK